MQLFLGLAAGYTGAGVCVHEARKYFFSVSRVRGVVVEV